MAGSSCSTGDPAGGVVVHLLKQAVSNGRAAWSTFKRATTGSEGDYRFGALPDGIYAIYTGPQMETASATTAFEPGSGQPETQLGYPVVFYPNARELASAARIRLRPGEMAQADISLAIEPFHTITADIVFRDGSILTPSAEKTATGLASAALTDSEGHFLPYRAEYDQATRTIHALLPNGTYTLTAVTQGSPGHEAATEVNAAAEAAHPAYFAGSIEFTVAGNTMPNLRIPLVAPHSYLLRLRTQPGAAEAGQTGFRASAEPGFSVRVSLEFAGEYTLEPGAERDAPMAGPEAFDLMVAPPFSFWLHTLVYGKGLCAGTLNANGANLSRDPLVLSYAGSTSPMELMVRSDCAKLHLSLPLTAASFVPGIEPVYTVYVVPEFDTTVDVHPQTLRPSSGGSLMIEGFTPGDYRVYTFTSPVDLEYRNPTAMAQLGTAGQVVTLAPLGTANLVLEVPGH